MSTSFFPPAPLNSFHSSRLLACLIVTAAGALMGCGDGAEVAEDAGETLPIDGGSPSDAGGLIEPDVGIPGSAAGLIDLSQGDLPTGEGAVPCDDLMVEGSFNDIEIPRVRWCPGAATVFIEYLNTSEVTYCSISASGFIYAGTNALRGLPIAGPKTAYFFQGESNRRECLRPMERAWGHGLIGPDQPSADTVEVTELSMVPRTGIVPNDAATISSYTLTTGGFYDEITAEITNAGDEMLSIADSSVFLLDADGLPIAADFLTTSDRLLEVGATNLLEGLVWRPSDYVGSPTTLRFVLTLGRP